MGDINVKMQHNYIAFLCTMLHVNIIIMLHVGVKNADSEGADGTFVIIINMLKLNNFPK